MRPVLMRCAAVHSKAMRSEAVHDLREADARTGGHGMMSQVVGYVAFLARLMCRAKIYSNGMAAGGR